MKKFFFILIISISVGFIAKSWHSITGGFRTNKLIPPQDYVSPVREFPKKGPDFFSIFNQQFTYLGKGCQVYVFESADKKYVIKFLRHHKYKPPYWLNLIDWTGPGKRYKKRITKYKKNRGINAFSSYWLAYDQLKEETSVEYLHFGKTDYGIKINVIDKIGQKWCLDLDKLDFVVQKRVSPLDSFLLSLSREKDLKRAQFFIEGFFKVISQRCLKGIKNVDHSGYIRNMGYKKDRVFEMDLGGYRKDPSLKTKEGFAREFMYFSSHLRKWVKKRAPNLKDVVDDTSNKVLCESLEKL